MTDIRKKFKPQHPAKDLVTTRSVYGQAVPALAPPRRLGMPPKSPFRTGTTGSRSSSMDVTASQLMQQTMTDQDVEYYEELEGDKPYDILRTYINEILLHETNTKNKNNGPKPEEDPEDEFDEASVAANVAGYTLPLGMSNKKKGQEPSWKAYARAYAGAKPVMP